MEELENVQNSAESKEAPKKKEGANFNSLVEMKQTLEGYKDQALGALILSCDQTGLNKKLTEEALRNTDRSHIENSSDETLKEFMKAIRKPNEPSEFYDGEDGLTNFKDMILNLKDLVDQVIECENQLDKINNAIRDVEISITSEIFSKEYIAKRLTEVDKLEITLKKKIEDNDYDSVEALVAARRDLRNCDELRKIYDLSFVNENIDYDKLIDTFLHRVSNDYCFKKCAVVLDKMKLSMASLNSFANLEESFLDKKYAMFNNLYLFFIIRLIGYMDANNKMDCLKVKTLIHGLVGFVSAPEKCEYIKNIIEEFYEPLMKRYEEKDSIVVKLADTNPYTSKNSEEIDEEIVETVLGNDRETAVSYIRHMILVDNSASTEEDVDAWTTTAGDDDIFEMREKISLLVKLGRFNPESMGIVGISFISLDGLKEDYDRMNAAYDSTIEK